MNAATNPVHGDYLINLGMMGVSVLVFVESKTEPNYWQEIARVKSVEAAEKAKAKHQRAAAKERK